MKTADEVLNDIIYNLDKIHEQAGFITPKEALQAMREYAQIQNKAITKHNSDLLSTITRNEETIEELQKERDEIQYHFNSIDAELEIAENLLKEVIDNVDFVSGDETIGKIFEYFKTGKVEQTKKTEEGWTLSRERMPDFDGMYYVYGWMHHECGNVTPFHKISECRINQWVKSDVGEQMTYWRPLLLPPTEKDEFESLKEVPELKIENQPEESKEKCPFCGGKDLIDVNDNWTKCVDCCNEYIN